MLNCQNPNAASTRPPLRTQLLIVGWWALTAFVRTQTVSADEQNTTTTLASRVVLPADKLASTGIVTSRVVRRRLQPTRWAPGRLRYDERRHVEVKTAAAGIVRQVVVKPGDRVKTGDLLAIVTSAEVGEKRADLLRLTADCDLAVRRLERIREISDGLRKLVEQIQHDADPSQAADEVETIALGEHRATLLSAYAAYRLAETMWRNGETSGASGALSGRQLAQRRGEYVAARATLQTAVERTQFDAKMAALEAENEVADAQRRVAICHQFVAALEGLGGAMADAATSDLSELRLLAPIDGTIETQRFAVSERIAPGDGLFIVADTSQLWVQADIREQEWGALQLEPGQSLAVTGPTLGGEPLTAKVHYVGREVSRATNAVAVVATVDNAQGRLRPGQFVQVRVPVAAAHDGLAIPESAIVTHDGQKFVFVQESPQSYRRVNVTTGVVDGDVVEILDGVAEGATLVTQGAFQLKSELLIGQMAE